MPLKRCRSNCTTNKSVASCNAADKCSYTNGPKRKFCRLSTKYRMNKPDCNITRKFLKREKGPAEKIRRFLMKKRASRKHNTQKKQTVSIELKDVLPTPPAVVVQGPSDEEIKKITDKAHTRRIQRFMKAVDPNKRRAAYLTGVCSDSGVCIAFGSAHKAKIKKHFDDFVRFRYAKSVRRIGAISANGFVSEIEYQNAGYTSHAVLKSTERQEADNLCYEYLVGLFLNEQSKFLPLFVETYGLFRYIDDNYYKKMKQVSASANDLGGLALMRNARYVKYDDKTNIDMISKSCTETKHLSVLIQNIKGAKTFSDMCFENVKNFVGADLAFVLFQIYHTLYVLNTTFTHNDLHTQNVLIYEPVKSGYIQYFYHSKNGSVTSFKSSYIPKIIDYGRCFYDFKNPSEYGVINNSKTIYKEVCDLRVCNPCGYSNGYAWLAPNTTTISVHDHNLSQDLRLLKMLQSNPNAGIVGRTINKHMTQSNPILGEILNHVVFKGEHFTPENTEMGSSSFSKKRSWWNFRKPDYKINNVIDAYLVLSNVIQDPKLIKANEDKYKSYKKIGEMHVYEDKPLEFISV